MIGRRINATKKLTVRMRTPDEIVSVVMQKIATANIDTVAEWNALLNDPTKFDEGEKRIIKLLLDVQETPPGLP